MHSTSTFFLRNQTDNFIKIFSSALLSTKLCSSELFFLNSWYFYRKPHSHINLQWGAGGARNFSWNSQIKLCCSNSFKARLSQALSGSLKSHDNLFWQISNIHGGWPIYPSKMWWFPQTSILSQSSLQLYPSNSAPMLLQNMAVIFHLHRNCCGLHWCCSLWLWKKLGYSAVLQCSA